MLLIGILSFTHVGCHAVSGSKDSVLDHRLADGQTVASLITDDSVTVLLVYQKAMC